MPVYLYQCPSCSSKRDVVKRIAEIDREESCPSCLSPMSRRLSAPAVRADLPAYNCPITGDLISGRRAHAENLAKHNCRILEPGEASAASRRASVSSQSLDSAIDATVEEFIHNLPVEKRDRLCAEIEAGATAEVVRN